MTTPASRLPDRPTNTVRSALLGTLVLGLLLTGLVSFSDRHHLGQPVRGGTVQQVEPTGEEGRCGRTCRCDLVDVVVAVDDGSTAYAETCAERFLAGDRVRVRSAPGRQSQLDPVSFTTIALGCTLLSGLLVLFGVLVARHQAANGAGTAASRSGVRR